MPPSPTSPYPPTPPPTTSSSPSPSTAPSPKLAPSPSDPAAPFDFIQEVYPGDPYAAATAEDYMDAKDYSGGAGGNLTTRIN